MNKRELMDALNRMVGVPDDAPVLLCPWPEGQPAPHPGDLHRLVGSTGYVADGPDGKPFITMYPVIEYDTKPAEYFYLSMWDSGDHGWFGPFPTAEAAKTHFDDDETYDHWDQAVVIGPLPCALVIRKL